MAVHRSRLKSEISRLSHLVRVRVRIRVRAGVRVRVGLRVGVKVRIRVGVKVRIKVRVKVGGRGSRRSRGCRTWYRAAVPARSGRSSPS